MVEKAPAIRSKDGRIQTAKVGALVLSPGFDDWQFNHPDFADVILLQIGV
jgi:hypothetical protein